MSENIKTTPSKEELKNTFSYFLTLIITDDQLLEKRAQALFEVIDRSDPAKMQKLAKNIKDLQQEEEKSKKKELMDKVYESGLSNIFYIANFSGNIALVMVYLLADLKNI